MYLLFIYLYADLYGSPFPPLKKKKNKVIATFYLTILTFFLATARYKLAILTFFLRILTYKLAILRYKLAILTFFPQNSEI